jgi:translation initiation factor 2 subunit 1
MCTVTKVFAQGAFVKLDEYAGKEGMIHITEVASGWIKNIRDFVREGKKVVAKVLSVDAKKGHIDLSMRRVKEVQRRAKAQQWKREQRAEKLLERAASSLGKDLDAAYEEVGFKLQDKFGDLYSAFEAVATKGKGVLTELATEEWVDVIGELAAGIEAPIVQITGYVDLSCPAPNGIEIIKSALMDAQRVVKTPEIEIEPRYVGSPRYSIRISAPSYKIAEEALQKAAEHAITAVKKGGGEGKLHPRPKR